MVVSRPLLQTKVTNKGLWLGRMGRRCLFSCGAAATTQNTHASAI